MKSKYSKYGLNRLIKDYLGLIFLNGSKAFYKFDETDFWKYQISQFEKTYKYALKHIPYYKKANYPSIDFSNCQTREQFFECIEKIPILTKSALKSDNELFFNKNSVFSKIHTTSGTSGTPLKLKANIFEKAELQMLKNYWFKKISGKVFPKLLILSGYYVPGKNDPIFFKDKFTNDVHLSIYGINSSNANSIKAVIEKERPDIIYGYASAVHLLAKELSHCSLDEKNKMVAVTTSEILQPDWREVIEKNLVKKVYNFYSSQECAHGVFENNDGHMKIHPRMGLLEILNSKNQRISSGLGKVVVTGFIRNSMPLIRYEIGDTVEANHYHSTSKSFPDWPEVGEIIGRSEDLVWKTDGSRVGYLCFHATKNVVGVNEAQIIQKDFQIFECLLSINYEATKGMIEEHIKKEIENRLAIDIQIDFTYVNFIPRGKNEKFKAVVVNFQPFK